MLSGLLSSLFLRQSVGALHTIVNGDGPSVYKGITQGAQQLDNGRFLLNNGINVGYHNSFENGFTINFKKAGILYKIRVK